MLGGVCTVRVARPLNTAPSEFTTKTVYTPLFVTCALPIEYVAFVARGMFTPLKRHWYRNGAWPVAVTLKLVFAPTMTVRDCGCWEIAGTAEETGAVAPPAVGAAATQFTGSLPY